MLRSFRAALCTLLLTGAGITAMTAPASAAYTTTVGPLTVTTGHVSTTVNSTAPYLKVSVTTYWGTEAYTTGVEANPGGDLPVTLETWGFGEAYLRVSACTTTTACTDPVTTPFTALDVKPTITWPTSTNVGAGQTFDITASDPDGGGRLYARWSQGTGGTIARDGTTPVHLKGDGTGKVVIDRCSSGTVWICRSTGVVRDVRVDASMYVSIEAPRYGGETITNGPLVILAHLRDTGDPESAGPIDVTWGLKQVGGGIVEGVGGKVTDLHPDSSGLMRVRTDLSAAPEGLYIVTAHAHWPGDAEFAELTSPTTQTPTRITLDKTPGTITSLTKDGSKVFPAKDGYFDAVHVTAKVTPGDGTNSYMEVLDASGNLVRRVTSQGNSTHTAYTWPWNGRNTAGTAVPGGVYTLRVRIQDRAGNLSAPKSTWVTVVRKHVAEKLLDRTVSAAGSQVKKIVGSCSAVKSPAAGRGWTGSIGLYSNARCSGTFDQSAAESIHAIKTPTNVYQRMGLTISVDGGAALAKSNSTAQLAYLNTSQHWTSYRTLTARYGTHDGYAVTPTKYVWSDGSVIWSVFTTEGARYDVKSFRVRLRYSVIVND